MQQDLLDPSAFNINLRTLNKSGEKGLAGETGEWLSNLVCDQVDTARMGSTF